MDNIEKAVDYAASTSKIEDMNLSKKELEELKKAIIEQKDTKVFVDDIVKKVEKDDKNK